MYNGEATSVSQRVASILLVIISILLKKNLRGLTIQFLDWCCSIHIRWWGHELLPSKCSSTTYQQLAGVDKSNH
jgi:hypothetical protein